jgi:hypothetical protein
MKMTPTTMMRAGDGWFGVWIMQDSNCRQVKCCRIDRALKGKHECDIEMEGIPSAQKQ